MSMRRKLYAEPFKLVAVEVVEDKTKVAGKYRTVAIISVGSYRY